MPMQQFFCNILLFDITFIIAVTNKFKILYDIMRVVFFTSIESLLLQVISFIRVVSLL